MTDTTRKRLVYLGDASSTTVTTLLGELAALGWRIDLISDHRPAPGTVLHPELKFHRLPISSCYPLTYGAFIFAAPLILLKKPQIVHACGLSSYGIMAAVHRRFLRFKPMVLTISGPDILQDARKGMTRWSADHALKMFEAVIAKNDEQTLAELTCMGMPVSRLTLLDTDNPDNKQTTAEKLAELYTGLLGGGNDRRY